jgi:hypothetical protein
MKEEAGDMADQLGSTNIVAVETPRRETIEGMLRRSEEIGRLASELIDLGLQLDIDDDACISTHIDTIREHASDLRRDMVSVARTMDGH